MKVAVRAFATLTALLPPGEPPGHASFEVGEGTTLRDMLDALTIPAGLSYLVLVNGQEVSPERVLEPGDVVTLFPPLVGG